MSKKHVSGLFRCLLQKRAITAVVRILIIVKMSLVKVALYPQRLTFLGQPLKIALTLLNTNCFGRAPNQLTKVELLKL